MTLQDLKDKIQMLENELEKEGLLASDVCLQKTYNKEIEDIDLYIANNLGFTYVHLYSK